MTFREKLMTESKERLVRVILDDAIPCPCHLGYTDETRCPGGMTCIDCWNREMPEKAGDDE